MDSARVDAAERRDCRPYTPALCQTICAIKSQISVSGKTRRTSPLGAAVLAASDNLTGSFIDKDKGKEIQGGIFDDTVTFHGESCLPT
jgi:hypothetical protein